MKSNRAQVQRALARLREDADVALRVFHGDSAYEDQLKVVRRLTPDAMEMARSVHVELTNQLAEYTASCGYADVEIVAVVNGLKRLVEEEAEVRLVLRGRSLAEMGGASQTSAGRGSSGGGQVKPARPISQKATQRRRATALDCLVPTNRSEEVRSKKAHESAALKALWESQAVAELLDEFLNRNDGHDVEGERTDIDYLEAQRIGLAVRVIRRGLQASADHFAESW